MKKTIYSLVLNSSVVKLIDEKAKNEGVSRSTMVNKVLAEYCGCSFDKDDAKKLLDETAKEVAKKKRLSIIKNSTSNITATATLNYKYSPKISYVIQLNDGGLNLTASVRTNSEELLNFVNNYFLLLNNYEKENNSKGKYNLDQNKIRRELILNGDYSENAANLIANYIENVHELLNNYVADFSDSNDENLINSFKEYLKEINI